MARTRIRPRSLAVLAALFLALTLPTASSGKSFKIVSQNMLHLGWGKNPKKTNKYNYFRNDVFGRYDVALMQEVMAKADMNQVNPGQYNWYMTAVKGRGSYREAYGFLVKNPANGGFNVAGNGWVDYPDLNNWFIRPPAGILVLSGNNPIWLVSYHAIYGKRKSQRVTEVRRMATVYNFFHGRSHGGKSSNRVAIAGDWNLPANDKAFDPLRQAIGANAQIKPTGKTSLKKNGGLSQPYDHFVWDGNDLRTAKPIDPPYRVSKKTFRTNYSDHLGIDAFVEY